jgi:hypothetical protein
MFAEPFIKSLFLEMRFEGTAGKGLSGMVHRRSAEALEHSSEGTANAEMCKDDGEVMC